MAKSSSARKTSRVSSNEKITKGSKSSKTGKTLTSMTKNVEKVFASCIKNKNVLYAIFSLYMLSIMGYVVSEDYQSLVLIVLLTVIVRLFGMNMIIVLAIPFLFVNGMVLFRYLFSSTREGLQNNEEDENSENSNNQDDSEDSGDEGESSNNNSEESEFNPHEQGNSSNTSNNNEENSSENANNSGDVTEELTNLIDRYEQTQKGIESVIDKSSMNPKDIKTQRLLMKEMGKMTPILKDSVKILHKVDINKLNDLIGNLGTVMKSNPLGVFKQ